MSLTIATWNINSVRLRIDLVRRFLSERQPDILCLQETKCRDSEFPTSEFRKAGYEHIAIHGQKGYHGVAIVSKRPFLNITRRNFCQKGDARHIQVDLAHHSGDKPLTLHNFYVPAGGDEPDPQVNEKFAHKLSFLDEMHSWFNQDKIGAAAAILVGDLNIAPFENDVWNHKAMLKVVSHTPIECEKLLQICNGGQWVDAMRAKIPLSEKLYSWWSYRSPQWETSDRGRRLDHIWLSQCIAPRLQSIEVHKAARFWERPSDHVPVVAELA